MYHLPHTYLTLQNNIYNMKETHKEYKKKWYQKYQWREYTAPKCRELNNFRCKKCGMSNEDHNFKNGCNLNVHHVIPRTAFIKAMEDGRTDSDKIRSIANDQKNLVPLCASCHKKDIEPLSISDQVKVLDIKDPRQTLKLPKLVKKQL